MGLDSTVLIAMFSATERSKKLRQNKRNDPIKLEKTKKQEDFFSKDDTIELPILKLKKGLGPSV